MVSGVLGCGPRPRVRELLVGRGLLVSSQGGSRRSRVETRERRPSFRGRAWALTVVTVAVGTADGQRVIGQWRGRPVRRSSQCREFRTTTSDGANNTIRNTIATPVIFEANSMRNRRDSSRSASNSSPKIFAVTQLNVICNEDNEVFAYELKKFTVARHGVPLWKVNF